MAQAPTSRASTENFTATPGRNEMARGTPTPTPSSKAAQVWVFKKSSVELKEATVTHCLLINCTYDLCYWFWSRGCPFMGPGFWPARSRGLPDLGSSTEPLSPELGLGHIGLTIRSLSFFFVLGIEFGSLLLQGRPPNSWAKSPAPQEPFLMQDFFQSYLHFCPFCLKYRFFFLIRVFYWQALSNCLLPALRPLCSIPVILCTRGFSQNPSTLQETMLVSPMCFFLRHAEICEIQKTFTIQAVEVLKT